MTVISEETANEWISQAYADPRLQSIIEEVEGNYELGVKIVEEAGWSSSIRGQRAVIEIAETDRPMAAFAHELLHLRLSARGYRHILGSGNHDASRNQLVSYFLKILDNELQHHKMFPDFIAAGFSASEFYADSDDAAHEDVRKQINALSSSSSAADACPAYLPLIAPGGGWPTSVREAAMGQLHGKVSPETWQRLLAVKSAIDVWASASDLDPTDTIVTIFEALGDFNGTYIAEDVSDYPTGAFIPRTMTQEQFERLGTPEHTEGLG